MGHKTTIVKTTTEINNVNRNKAAKKNIDAIDEIKVRAANLSKMVFIDCFS